MAVATTQPYLKYDFRAMKALREIEKCRDFILSNRMLKYANQYPERILRALVYVDEARTFLNKSNSAFFGGEISVFPAPTAHRGGALRHASSSNSWKAKKLPLCLDHF